MNTTERKDFEAELAVMFAGFPTFLTEPRIEAYWRGLAKMSLGMFKRCVEFTLSEAGEEKLPTVKRVWEISRKVTAESRVAVQTAAATPDRPFDVFVAHGNRVLLSYLRTHGAASESALAEMVRAKNKLIEDYRSICTVEPHASLELRDKLTAAFDKLIVRMPAQEVHRHTEMQSEHVS